MNTEMSKYVNTMDLINLFKDMEKRGTLLSGKGANSKDCLMQIIGTICHLAFESTNGVTEIYNRSKDIADAFLAKMSVTTINNQTPNGHEPDKLAESLLNIRNFSYPIYSINNGERIVTFGKVPKLKDEYRLIDLTTGMIDVSCFDTYKEVIDYITNPVSLHIFLKCYAKDIHTITRIL